MFEETFIIPDYFTNFSFPLQVHSFQRKTLQVPGMWERILSVQDSCRPQNITHAGEGTEAV